MFCHQHPDTEAHCLPSSFHAATVHNESCVGGLLAGSIGASSRLCVHFQATVSPEWGADFLGKVDTFDHPRKTSVPKKVLSSFLAAGDRVVVNPQGATKTVIPGCVDACRMEGAYIGTVQGGVWVNVANKNNPSLSTGPYFFPEDDLLFLGRFKQGRAAVKVNKEKGRGTGVLAPSRCTNGGKVGAMFKQNEGFQDFYPHELKFKEKVKHPPKCSSSGGCQACDKVKVDNNGAHNGKLGSVVNRPDKVVVKKDKGGTEEELDTNTGRVKLKAEVDSAEEKAAADHAAKVQAEQALQDTATIEKNRASALEEATVKEEDFEKLQEHRTDIVHVPKGTKKYVEPDKKGWMAQGWWGGYYAESHESASKTDAAPFLEQVRNGEWKIASAWDDFKNLFPEEGKH